MSKIPYGRAPVNFCPDGAIQAPEPLLPHQYPARAKTERMIDHLHRLGPRSIGELLNEIAKRHNLAAEIRELLAEYGRLTPSMVQVCGADHWPPPPLRVIPR